MFLGSLVDSRAPTKAVFKKNRSVLAAAWFRGLVAVVALIFAGVVLTSLWSQITSSQVLIRLSDAPATIFVVVVVAAAASLLRAERLYQIVKAMCPTLGRQFAYVSFAYGMLLSFTPARSAELLRFNHRNNASEVDLKLSIRVFIAEKALDVLAVLVIAASAFVGVWVGIILLLLLWALIGRLRPRLRVVSAVGSVWIKSILISSAAWFAEGAGLYFMLIRFGNELFSVQEVTAAFAISSVLGSLSFVPAGILISEVSFLSLIGSDSGEVFIIVLLSRLAILATNLVLGISAWLMPALNIGLSRHSPRD